MAFSTLFGGSGTDDVVAIAVDGSGNIYIAGYTDSSDIPRCRTSTRGGGVDAFVAKWNASANQIEYCTYLGGSDDDRASGIAVDAAGNAYVTGCTTSSDFPTLSSLQAHSGGGKDAFIAKLNPAGGLAYSTYIGGSGSDSGNAIAVDASGNVTVVGDTDSSNSPVRNPFQGSRRGPSDAFIVRVGAAGNNLIYATYFGGAGEDHAYAVALDSLGGTYFTHRR
jgi:hypothetical protein